MCLSIPAKVLEIQGDTATVSVGGNQFTAGLQMLDDVEPGDYVLLHAGFAIQKISDQEARETLDLLREMGELP
jgi:hydrogenase expression/formation protein HypC